ncbi:thiamine pyrophosphate-binding protein [Roseateles sp. SL47]|uniref:thiamine pyrophosphate-binding protein n=1 Tax=Roseateles sp. SL47 TaxID=2995138 RepID=UPI0022706E95|nr:thiamine pyrophosphate-binding protein [Roseateles sp. SL47]WAC71022.1 thiamine pyrophosphate-binding protein [Roseateles sp. SL47]
MPWLHGGDLVAQQLRAEGIDRLFVLTGGHVSPIFDGAFYQDIGLIDFRHEQSAAHAADAYARLRRRPAVAVVTAGPGFTCALTGLANAHYSQSPMVLLAGRNPLATDGAGNLQDAPQVELARPITKFAQTAFAVDRITAVMSQAFTAARAPRMGPAMVDFPIETLLARVAPEDCSVPATPVSAAHPDPADVRRVARWLAEAQSPVLVAGSGAYMAGCGEALAALADAARLPVFMNGMGRGLLPARHPMVRFRGRAQALAQADLVICLGVDFDFRLGFGQGIAAHGGRVVQVDADASRLARNRPVSLAVCADCRTFSEALLGQTSAFSVRHALAVQAELPKPWEGSGRDEPIDPRDMVRVVSDFLDPDATVIGDGGDIVALFAAYHRSERPGSWMDPGPFGCLGIGPAFAMAARLAQPDRQVAVISGDGAFGFNAMELDSAVRQKLPFVVVIGNDRAWGEMRTFHEDMFGGHDPRAQYLGANVRYDLLAQSLGGHGERVTRLRDLQPALARAFRSGVPAVVDVILDPAFRRPAETISGKHVAAAYGGDPLAYRRGPSAVETVRPRSARHTSRP